MQPDVYAVQGYDAAQLLAAGLAAVKGDVSKKDAMRSAMSAATIDSPRGKFTLSKANNPIQDIYLRQVKGEQRSEEHTSAFQSLMRISYAVFCLKTKQHIYSSTSH